MCSAGAGRYTLRLHSIVDTAILAECLLHRLHVLILNLNSVENHHDHRLWCRGRYQEEAGALTTAETHIGWNFWSFFLSLLSGVGNYVT